jgi:hypothetical protein
LTTVSPRLRLDTRPPGATLVALRAGPPRVHQAHTGGVARQPRTLPNGSFCGDFSAARARSSPPFARRSTTHNREVPGSNPGGAMEFRSGMRFLLSTGGSIAAIHSVVRSSIARFRRCRARSDSAMADESPFRRPPRVHNQRPFAGKRGVCRPLAGEDCRRSRIATVSRRSASAPHLVRSGRGRTRRSRPRAAVNSPRLRFPVVVSLCRCHLLVGCSLASRVTHSA